MTIPCSFKRLVACFLIYTAVYAWRPQLLGRRPYGRVSSTADNFDSPSHLPPTLEYDMIIVGAGASGMFAAGASTMLGQRTLLLDLGTNETSNIGGDCTNSACVPSKALRSIAKMASLDKSSWAADSSVSNTFWFSRAQNHMATTVNKVRTRESPEAMVERNPNLDIALLTKGRFVGPHEMDLAVTNFYSYNTTKKISNQEVRAQSKNFLIATGSSPIVPKRIEKDAKAAGLPLWTYRTLLRPSVDSFWQLMENRNNDKPIKIVVAGGGATAMELCQSLARLGVTPAIELHMIAPELLPGEDVTLQNAALQLLSAEKAVRLHLGRRLESVLPDKSIKLTDESTIPEVDGLLLCFGRRPALGSLHLDNAGIDWNENHGVEVKLNLQSTSASHVYACGDCASAVNQGPTSRTSTHGAWTGYHAASNAILPKFLTRGSKSIHPTVPRVIYTDPELACVGMSLSECVQKYGWDGFDRLLVSEKVADRADMESLQRSTSGIGFIEIRATKVDGKVLGMTACGPTASELANEMSIAIENGLTVRDIARSLHSYPSHGYLLHRVALAMALGNIWGSLEACGPVGGLLAHPGRLVSKIAWLFKRHRLGQATKEWAAEGASKGVMIFANQDMNWNAGHVPPSQILSFLDIHKDEKLRQRLLSENDNASMNKDAFIQWSSQAKE